MFQMGEEASLYPASYRTIPREGLEKQQITIDTRYRKRRHNFTCQNIPNTPTRHHINNSDRPTNLVFAPYHFSTAWFDSLLIADAGF